jgi:hypothetical protein
LGAARWDSIELRILEKEISMNSGETKTEPPALLRAAESGDLDQVKRIIASDSALLDQVQDQV